MGFEYEARLLELTPDECREEIRKMNDDAYRYGRSIDRPYLWDLNYTIKMKEQK